MKSYTVILLTSFLILSLVSCGQQVDPGKTKKAPVLKGYYSIGNNADKIRSTSLIDADMLTSAGVTKGFYSIKANKGKLPKRLTWFRTTNPKPVITKGYYSIGDHWKRIHQ